MKQILFSTFIIFIAFLIGNKIVNAREIQYERSTSVYVRRNLGNSFIDGRVRKYIEYNTNHTLFSTEPFKGVPDVYAHYDINDEITISNEVKEIAYVADLLYQDTYDLTYIAVGQKMIWDLVKNKEEIYFYDKNGRNDILYINYEKEINDKINKLFPKLNIPTEISLNLNDNIELSDELLNDYEIVNSKGTSSISYINDDKLMIKGESRGITELILKKDIGSKDYEMKLFSNETESDFISSGNFSSFVILNINVTSGDFFLNVLGEDIEDGYNASYGIFKNDKLIYRFDINNKGFYKTELPCDNYVVKQLSISPLYLKDDKEYVIKIDENRETILEVNTLRNREINEVVDNINEQNKEENTSGVLSEIIELSVPDTFSNTNTIILLGKSLYVKKKDYI
ncbi:MAG: hypothetical protein ACI31M_00450 [Bacilli bacterium]